MDAIDTIDVGAYAHFTFVASNYPEIIQFVKSYNYVSVYVILIGPMAAVFALFVWQKRMRAALVTAMGFVVSMGIIEACRLLVPRRRPDDALELVGANDMIGSYPSAGVFLFILLMIYVGLALWPWLRSSVARSLFVGVAAALTVGVAMFQFFLALHFVSDVVGGLMGAAIVGFVVARCADATPAVNN